MGPNPGLDKRLQAFKEDGLRVEDNDAEEFIEQSDSSFYNVSVQKYRLCYYIHVRYCTGKTDFIDNKISLKYS